jgi:CBS domain-containing protein
MRILEALPKKKAEKLVTNSGRLNRSPVEPDQLRQFVTLQVKSAMSRNVLTVHKHMTLRELDRLFSQYDFNGFPVVEDHHVIGVVTKFDLLRSFILNPNSVIPRYDHLMKRSVEEIMTTEIHTVYPTTPLTRVLEMMINTRVRSVPVVDAKNRLQGIISRGDIVRALNG